MVSALPGRANEPESSLRCRQMVAAENEGQCFRLNVLYDWGATVSMISEEAVEVMGLAITKQAKRIIKSLGGASTMSRGTCTLSLVARNGDRKTVTAWQVGEIASLPGGEPPEDVDEQFPGLRYLSEPNCLIQEPLTLTNFSNSFQIFVGQFPNNSIYSNNKLFSVRIENCTV